MYATWDCIICWRYLYSIPYNKSLKVNDHCKKVTSLHCTAIHFVSISAKFGICTVVGLNGRLLKLKYALGTLECAYFSFNKCPLQTNDGANAKFSTNRDKMDCSVSETALLAGIPSSRYFLQWIPTKSHYYATWVGTSGRTFWWDGPQCTGCWSYTPAPWRHCDERMPYSFRSCSEVVINRFIEQLLRRSCFHTF